MSDLKDRVGVLTGGNADLIVNPGDLITGDGRQCVYLRANTGVDGNVLILDSTVEDGLRWGAGGGGGGDVTGVTGSDGVTVTDPTGPVPNATNDLVTGVDVAQLNVDSLAGATIDAAGTIALTNSNSAGAEINLNAGANITIQAGVGPADVGGVIVIGNAGAVQLQANGADGDVVITANESLTTTAADMSTNTSSGGWTANVAAQIDLLAGTSFTLGSTGANEMTFNASRDEVHTIGRNLLIDAAGAAGSHITATIGTLELNSGLGVEITATGAGGIVIDATTGNTAIAGGSGDGTGEVRIQTGTASATRTFQIWTGAGAPQRDGDILPAGGVVIDAEMRAAFQTLVEYFFDWGWITNPAP